MLDEMAPRPHKSREVRRGGSNEPHMGLEDLLRQADLLKSIWISIYSRAMLTSVIGTSLHCTGFLIDWLYIGVILQFLIFDLENVVMHA